MSELTSEFQRMADEAARQARPPAAADILRQGDRRRRHSRTRQSLGGLSAAGVVGTGVALGLGLAGSAPGPSTIQTAAFLLVKNANGTATLTINANVLLEPGTLQRDLARDGIPAMVTVGSFCSTSPVPSGIWQVISVPKLHRPAGLPSPLASKPGHLPSLPSPGSKPGQLPSPPPLASKPGRLPPPPPLPSKPRPLPSRTLTINPAALPAGTELSFGNFRLANDEETFYELIDKSSYTCTSTAPATPPANGGETIFTNGAS